MTGQSMQSAPPKGWSLSLSNATSVTSTKSGECTWGLFWVAGLGGLEGG